MPDIDIDVPDRSLVTDKIPCVPARIDRENGHEQHNTGVYFQAIPKNPLDGIATIDHKIANELGYFKIDILNNMVYRDIRDEQHLIELMEKEPNWDRLSDQQFVSGLYHLNNHYDLVKEYMPKNTEQLAQLLAIIRPAKSYLRGKSWSEIEKAVWTPPRNRQYYFKKAHAIAFAILIQIQMNLHENI
jgi:hypothetical protein